MYCKVQTKNQLASGTWAAERNVSTAVEPCAGVGTPSAQGSPADFAARSLPPMWGSVLLLERGRQERELDTLLCPESLK